MNWEKIRIKAKSGNIVKRNAAVFDFLLDGKRHFHAYIGSVPYEIIERDDDGPIYAEKATITYRILADKLLRPDDCNKTCTQFGNCKIQKTCPVLIAKRRREKQRPNQEVMDDYQDFD